MRRFVPPISKVLLSAVAVFVLGCSGGGAGSTSQPPSTPASTTTSLALSSASTVAGSTVTLTATVTAASGNVSAGSVTFYDGSTSLASAALNSTGQAAWSGSAFAAGTHSLTASYAGNSSYAASTSSAAALTVIAKPSLQSSVALTASSSSAVQGLPVKLTATVSALSGSTLPTGSVAFAIGSITLATAAVDSTGVAALTETRLPVGANSITATYSGDTNFASSTSGALGVGIGKAAASTFVNPLALNVTGSQRGVSCADPAIYKDQQGGVNTWYLYCTSDALYVGDPNAHYLAIYKSSDLVNYTYLGNAFAGLPSWANVSGASLWAPAIKYFNGQYYLYYAASATGLTGNGSAIGVGVASSPAGPFVDHGAPVVEPELATNCCAGSYRSTIDPDVIQDASGQRYILFGSFTGGLYVRHLSADGFTSDPASEVHVGADNRYEGGNWWFHGGYYYLFASSTNCCNGPLSGYGVFAGRATTPMGPYLDAQGIDMAATNPGGSPVIRMNGNSVIGPGGNVIFTDEAGQDYILYHGIVAAAPYYAGSVGYTARPGYIDAIDWVNGWPLARGGYGPSDADAPQPLPAAQPAATNSYTTALATPDLARTEIAALSDDFTGTSLNPQWSFLHATPIYSLTGSAYQVNSVAYDPLGGMSNVPLLAESAPVGDYMVETKIDLNLPTSGVGPDYAQAGLLLYADDANFVRVDLYNNNDTRQVEFINAVTPAASGYPSWGGTSLGPAALSSDVSVWVRIVKRNVNGEEHYTAYSSNDDVNWIEGGVWVHALGNSARICLYAGNRSGYQASFKYVHVSTLQ